MSDLVYILAASHSGSTLLAMLLGAHPETCTVGELKATSLGDVERYLCSCGERIKQCPFWKKVSGAMARRGVPFDVTEAGTDFQANGTAYTRALLRPLHRGPLAEKIRDAALWLSPGWRTRLAEIQRRNAALVDALCEVSGARVIIDSSKVALRLKYLLRNPALSVRVIRLIRDGRGVALTYIEERGLKMAEAAHEWRRSNEEAEHLLAGMDPSRWVEVRYERLCAEPERTLRRLFAFLGVDPSKGTLDFRSVEHHVIGNSMRLDRCSEIRLDERWRSVLTAEDLRAFDAVAGKMNKRYGYA